MQARIEFLPVIYGSFAGRLGKYVGDYGRNFVNVQFPDKTVRAFPKEDVTFLEQGVTTSKTDRIRKALASEELLVYGQLTRAEPYGKQWYLKKEQVRGFYGLNFVRLAGNVFPVGDVAIEVIERNDAQFDYRNVTKAAVSETLQEFRVLQYFRDWSEYSLIVDHVEWLYKTPIPMDQRQVLVEYLVTTRTGETIWTYASLDAKVLALANLEPEDASVAVTPDVIWKEIVADSAQNPDKYTKLFYNAQSGLKHIYMEYLQSRKKMPMSQKIVLAIEVFNQIIGGYGRSYLEAVDKKANPDDYEMALEEKQELFPQLESILSPDRVRFMKNDPGRKADIDAHPALDRLYDVLISLYLSLLDQWEAARNDFNGIPDVEAGYEYDSFSYEYLIGLCHDIQAALLAFDALENKPVDLAGLKNQFKDAKGVRRNVTRNPKKRMERTL